MSLVILYSVLTLGAVAAFAAMILFVVAKKFRVEEDPRINKVERLLPGANCGGCGYPGCRGFAEALVSAANDGSISHLKCPPGGIDTMSAVGELLGLEVPEADPSMAVLCCGGTCEKAPMKLEYDGPSKCAVEDNLFSGEKGCPYGCLGKGDCIVVCEFDAMFMDEETKLPVILEDKCVSCGACVDACPRNLIEIRPKGRKGRRVWVNCRNKERGGDAIINCKATCIGCGKCVNTCPDKVRAITLEDNLAYIDPRKCITCGKCIPVCPTKAIRATFTPPRPKPKPKPKPAGEKNGEDKKQEVNA